MARRKKKVTKKVAKKAKPINEEIPQDSTSLDREETTAEAKLRIHLQTEKQRKALKYLPLKKYYYIKGYRRHNGDDDGKIILVRYKSNGSKYRTYIGSESKLQDFVKEIKSKGLLKNQKGTRTIEDEVTDG